MFDSFRDKIQSVQEGITARYAVFCLWVFKGLTYYAISLLIFVSSFLSFHRISSGETSRPIPIHDTVNLNAGAELLLKYQTEWHDGHQLAEENAAKAQVLSTHAQECL